MAEPKPRRFRRWLRRLVLAGLAGGLVLIAWLLLLPVPIGWAVNWATRRAVPPGQGLTLGVRAATFRWHLGAGELDLTMEDPTAVATDGRPVAKVSQIRLVFNKAALFGHHWLPAKVEVTQPVLTLDFKGSGWPSRAMAASAAKPVAVVPGRIEATALQPWLPAEGVPFALEVSGLAVELRAPERTVTWHFQPIETTLTREGENLALALALRLEGGSKPVGLKGHVEGKLSAHTLHFSATVPSFGTDDLPPLPLDPLALPPARLRGLAFDVDGTVDLDRVALPDLHFHLLAEDGELNLPRIKAGGPILLHRFEAAGYAADNAKTIAFDLLALELDSLHLTATKTRLVTGAAPALQADIALTGPDGSDVVAWLPAATAQALPFPASGLREVGITRLETHLEASLTSSDLVGASLQTLSLSGQLTLALGGHPVPFSFNAALPASGGPVIARLELAGVRLAALGDLALLKGYAPARAFDLPVRVSAELTATPHGEWRTARVTLTTTEPGTLRAFGPLVRDVPVKSFALVAETPDAGHSIRVGTLALDLDGPKLSVENLAVKLAPAASDPIELEGNIAAEQFPGAFLASFLPKDQLASLTPYGVTPADLQLDRVTGGFTARLVPGDRPAAATFKGEVTAHFQSQPLALGLEAALAGPDLSATLDLARVNPARFHLQLPGSLPLAAIDVPVQVQTRLTADTTGRLKTVTVHAEGGPGLFHATEQIFNADVPVTAFKIDVTADGAFQHLRLNSLAMDLDGVGVTAGPAALDPGVAGGAPLQVSGTVALAHLTVGHLLQWWPADLQPGLRGQIAPFVQSGELTRAAFTFAAPFDPTHPESTRPTALTGGAQFGNLHATPGQAPGPVTVQEVTVSVSWPGANVTVMNFAAPGVTVPAATVSLSALDQR